MFVQDLITLNEARGLTLGAISGGSHPGGRGRELRVELAKPFATAPRTAIWGRETTIRHDECFVVQRRTTVLRPLGEPT